jgi:hypothetical protein
MDGFLSYNLYQPITKEKRYELNLEEKYCAGDGFTIFDNIFLK